MDLIFFHIRNPKHFELIGEGEQAFQRGGETLSCAKTSVYFRPSHALRCTNGPCFWCNAMRHRSSRTSESPTLRLERSFTRRAEIITGGSVLFSGYVRPSTAMCRYVSQNKSFDTDNGTSIFGLYNKHSRHQIRQPFDTTMLRADSLHQSDEYRTRLVHGSPLMISLS